MSGSPRKRARIQALEAQIIAAKANGFLPDSLASPPPHRSNGEHAAHPTEPTGDGPHDDDPDVNEARARDELERQLALDRPLSIEESRRMVARITRINAKLAEDQSIPAHERKHSAVAVGVGIDKEIALTTSKPRHDGTRVTDANLPKLVTLAKQIIAGMEQGTW